MGATASEGRTYTYNSRVQRENVDVVESPPEVTVLQRDFNRICGNIKKGSGPACGWSMFQQGPQVHDLECETGRRFPPLLLERLISKKLGRTVERMKVWRSARQELQAPLIRKRLGVGNLQSDNRTDFFSREQGFFSRRLKPRVNGRRSFPGRRLTEIWRGDEQGQSGVGGPSFRA